jgi:hypothetical protein
MNQEPEDYEYRLIAWLDILGFRDFIKNEDSYTSVKSLLSDLNRQLTRGYYDVATEKTEENKISTTHTMQPRVSLISDTIVVSLDIKGELNFMEECRIILPAISLTVAELQCKLLFNPEFAKYNLSLRGAITAGKVCHDTLQVFGPAVNSLYKYESEVAIYPRVILTTELASKVSNILSQSYFKKDSDGYYYVDFLKYEEMISLTRVDVKSTLPNLLGKHKIFMSNLDNLKQRAKNYSKEKNDLGYFSIASKWQWLVEYIANFEPISEDIKKEWV